MTVLAELTMFGLSAWPIHTALLVLGVAAISAVSFIWLTSQREQAVHAFRG